MLYVIGDIPVKYKWIEKVYIYSIAYDIWTVHAYNSFRIVS